MNIAIIIQSLSGGGAERVAQIVGDHYIENGDKVYYFIWDLGLEQAYPVKGEVINTGIKNLDRNDLFGKAQIVYNLLIASLRMRHLKKKYKIDVAVSFLEDCNYVNVLSKGREKVITRVCSTLSKRKLETDRMDAFWYDRKVVRFFYSKADRIIVLSRYGLRDMQQYFGISPEKMYLIPNGVEKAKTIADQKMWSYGKKAIICVGRLVDLKQQERIIQAFSYVYERDKEARLLMIGKGPRLHYLKNMVTGLGLEESVIFVGFTSDVAYYLKHGRVFIMASKSEGFPNAMIEAMNYGLPVVTTDTPGACKEIVGKCRQAIFCGNAAYELREYGILTPRMPLEKIKGIPSLVEEEKIFGEAILQVLQDDNLYETYHLQSIKRANHFRIDKVIKRWDKLIYQTENDV